jgi:hypothetical protein
MDGERVEAGRAVCWHEFFPLIQISGLLFSAM